MRSAPGAKWGTGVWAGVWSLTDAALYPYSPGPQTDSRPPRPLPLGHATIGTCSPVSPAIRTKGQRWTSKSPMAGEGATRGSLWAGHGHGQARGSQAPQRLPRTALDSLANALILGSPCLQLHAAPSPPQMPRPGPVRSPSRKRPLITFRWLGRLTHVYSP